MMRKNMAVCAAFCLIFVVGCPSTPPPEAVLEGTWSVTPADPGDFSDWEYEATFDSSGNMTELAGTRDDGATATLDTSGSTTVLDGSTVTITIGTVTGAKVFEGTLSSDQNTITGSTTEEIDLGGLEVVLPGGNLTFERLEDADPCDDVTCEDGEECVDGECEATDPCDGVTCEDGEECVEGECEAVDPCDGVTCEDGESCDNGQCVPDAITGDPVAGEAFYTANSCAACHGDDATGDGAPSLIDVDADTFFDKLSGAVSHVGGTVDGVTEQDAADLAAWTASS